MRTKTLITYSKNSFIDLKMLFEFCGDDNDAIMEIMDMFIDSLTRVLQQLDSSYKDKNIESIYVAAHKAKSSLSIVQIKALWDGMDQLENEAREKKWNKNWINTIQQLSKTWQQIEPVLNQWKKDNIHTKVFKVK